MARLARLNVPGIPHHVTQRGARRMQTFFGDEDYHAYRPLGDDGFLERLEALTGRTLKPRMRGPKPKQQ